MNDVLHMCVHLFHRICLLGDRLLSHDHISPVNGSEDALAGDWCNKSATTGDIWHRYCTDLNGSEVCDPFFINSELRYIPGIPGITSGVLKSEWSLHLRA